MIRRIFLPVVFSLVAIVPACLATPLSDVTVLKIIALANESGNSEWQGSLEVRFENASAGPLTIMMARPFAKAFEGKDMLYVDPSERFRAPARFASIYYKWTNSKGKTVLAGTYLASHNDIRLKAKRSSSVWVPIKIPKSGTYELLVIFDNQNLEEVARSYNAADFDARFGKVETRTNVTIK